MSAVEKAHQGMQEAVAKACAKSPHGLSIADVQVQRLGEAVGLTETMKEELEGHLTGEIHSRIDSIQIFEIDSASSGPIRLVVRWSGITHMPHELHSVAIGKLPCALYLLAEEGVLTPRWQWAASGRVAGRVVDALTVAGKELHPDTSLEMKQIDRSYPLEWGIQAVPVDADKFVYAVQLAPGLISANIGVDDYLAKRSALQRVVAALAPEACELADFRCECHAQAFARSLFPEMQQRMVSQANDQRLTAARRLLEAGQFKQARYALDEALRAEPENQALVGLREEVGRRILRVDELEKQAKQLARGGDLEAAAASYTELLELVKGDKAKAREVDASIKQLAIERVGKLFKAAQALAASGDASGAAEKLRVLLTLKPGHVMARELLAKCGGA